LASEEEGPSLVEAFPRVPVERRLLISSSPFLKCICAMYQLVPAHASKVFDNRKTTKLNVGAY
jgi:hypothetical protein